ncbi:hypothetical protein GH733_001731 [Mirounga leonina]|nr:hypothetical protein GH733_001731 [Mirounga leonina]
MATPGCVSERSDPLWRGGEATGLSGQYKGTTPIHDPAAASVVTALKEAKLSGVTAWGPVGKRLGQELMTLMMEFLPSLNQTTFSNRWGRPMEQLE